MRGMHIGLAAGSCLGHGELFSERKRGHSLNFFVSLCTWCDQRRTSRIRFLKKKKKKNSTWRNRAHLLPDWNWMMDDFSGRTGRRTMKTGNNNGNNGMAIMRHFALTALHTDILP